MATQKFSLALQTMKFPLLPSLRGETVRIPNLDTEQQELQAVWAENIMPTSQGIASVGYETFTRSQAAYYAQPFIKTFDNIQVVEFYLEDGTNTLLMHGTDFIAVYHPTERVWNMMTSYLTPTDGHTSVMFLKGISYFFHPDLGLFSVYSSGTYLYANYHSMNGLSYGNVISMTAANSYFLAATEDTIHWSSPLNQFNFDPTLIGSNDGAGASQQLGAKGKVVTLQPVANGAVMYTTENAVLLKYTSNPVNPWFSTELAGSSGVLKPEHVTAQDNRGMQVAWSHTGLTVLQEQGMSPFLTEVTEMLSGTVYEFWDYVGEEFIKEQSHYRTEVKMLSGRYLCISYGRKSDELYSFALVYDTELKRMGKLKLEHRSLFEFNIPALTEAPSFVDLIRVDMTFSSSQPDTFIEWLHYRAGEEQRTSIGALQADLATLRLDFTSGRNNMDGVVVYGDVSLTRNRSSEVLEMTLEGTHEQDAVLTKVRSAWIEEQWSDWKDLLYYPRVQKRLARSHGKVHQLAITGQDFDLSSATVTLQQTGIR